MVLRSFGLAAAIAFTSVFASACSVSTAAPAPAGGTLELTWTIAGTTDPSACNQSVVDSLQVTITDVNGAFFGNYAARCADFAIAIDLPPGRFGGYAKLVDPGGNPRTTTIDIVPFDIISDTKLDVPIDFPSSSFE